MSNALVKTYWSYHEMIVDLGTLSPEIDVERTLCSAPPLCFYKRDGSIVLGGNIINFLAKLKDETGIKVNPFASEEHRGYTLICFEDYAPVEQKEQAPIEIKPVDTPAKKRAQRKASA